MKHILYTIVCSIAILFASCTKNDVLITTDEAGYLLLQNVEKISPVVSTVTSRADANTQADDLTVEIWQGEKLWNGIGLDKRRKRCACLL
mgnify:CR=1 FL=1